MSSRLIHYSYSRVAPISGTQLNSRELLSPNPSNTNSNTADHLLSLCEIGRLHAVLTFNTNKTWLNAHTLHMSPDNRLIGIILHVFAASVPPRPQRPRSTFLLHFAETPSTHELMSSVSSWARWYSYSWVQAYECTHTLEFWRVRATQLNSF